MKKTFRKIINGSLLAIHVFLLLGFIGCIRAGAWVDALMAFILGIIPVVVYVIVNKDNSKNKEERDKFFCCPFCKAELELPERVKNQKAECGICGNTFIVGRDQMFGKLQDCISTAITFCKSHKGWLCILIVAVILAIIFLPQCRYTIVKVQNGIYRTDNFTGKTVFIRGIRIMECVDECEIKESPKPVAVYTPPKPTVVYTQPKPAQPRYIPPKSIVRNLTSNEIAKVSCEVESSKYTGGSPFVRGRFHNGNRNIHITAIEVELCNIHPIAELKKDVQVYAIKTDIAPLTMRNHSFETVKFYRSSFKWRIVSAKGKVTLEEIDWDSLPIITPKATVGIP